MARNDLSAVGGQREVGVGAEVRGDFLCLEFVDIQSAGLQRRVVQLEQVLDRVPGPDLGRGRLERAERQR